MDISTVGVSYLRYKIQLEKLLSESTHHLSVQDHNSPNFVFRVAGELEIWHIMRSYQHYL